MARPEQILVQSLVDSGQIADMAQLLAFAEENGWTRARNGEHYITLLSKTGYRFRVYFQFENNLPFANVPRKNRGSSGRISRAKNRTPGYWIYGLISYGANEAKACYIGQTTNPYKRFRDHVANRKQGYSSSGLFEWAMNNGGLVYVVLLDFVPDESNGERQASLATSYEGYWLRQAIGAGYEAPLSENWGRFPVRASKAISSGASWLDQEVRAVCKAVYDVVQLEPPCHEFATPLAARKFADATRK